MEITCDECGTVFGLTNLEKLDLGTVEVHAFRCPGCETLYPSAAYNDEIRARLDRMRQMADLGLRKQHNDLLHLNRTEMRELLNQHRGDLELHGKVH